GAAPGLPASPVRPRTTSQPRWSPRPASTAAVLADEAGGIALVAGGRQGPDPVRQGQAPGGIGLGRIAEDVPQQLLQGLALGTGPVFQGAQHVVVEIADED